VKKEFSVLFVPAKRSARSPDVTPYRKSILSISPSYLTLSKCGRSGAIPAGLCVHVLDSKVIFSYSLMPSDGDCSCS